MDDDQNAGRAERDGDGYDTDPHGRAALLLVESLIHVLVDRSIISLDDAVEVVDVAVDVTSEMVLDRQAPAMELARSRALLASIGQSLRINLPSGPG